MQGAGQCRRIYSLLFCSNDIHGHDRQNRPVHGHGYRHAIQGDLVKQNLHILNGINSDAGFTNIAGYPRMVRVIAAVGGKVEGNGKPSLSGRKVGTIKGIGFFSRGESCVLTNSPWATRVHGCLWAPSERLKSRHRFEVGHVVQIVCGIDRLHDDTFRGRAVETLQGLVPKLFARQGFPVFFGVLTRIYRAFCGFFQHDNDSCFTNSILPQTRPPHP